LTLSGPVGVAVGAVAGTLTGSLFDLARLGVRDDFLTEAKHNARVAKLRQAW